jgi:hypothetical protein
VAAILAGAGEDLREDHAARVDHVCALRLEAGGAAAIVELQLPALLVFLPPDNARDIASVLGTNKAASIWGTGTAVLQYAPRIGIPWRSILPAATIAFVTALGGAMLVSYLGGARLEPIMLILLVGVTLYTAMTPDLGHLHAPAFTAHRERSLGVVVGALLGFYDGFFGPGTGSMLMIAFVLVFGDSLTRASGNAKAVNLASNLAALLLFALRGAVVWRIALPMAAANALGSFVGARFALKGGDKFVRIIVLGVVTLLVLKMAYDLVR